MYSVHGALLQGRRERDPARSAASTELNTYIVQTNSITIQCHFSYHNSFTFTLKKSEKNKKLREKNKKFRKKIRNFKVLSTTMLFMDDEDKAPEKLREYWKDDPVHMTAEGYEELVTAVTKVISSATFNRPAHGRPGKSSGHHAGGRGGSRGGSRKQSQWVCEDNTVAHRRDEDSSGGYKKFCGGRDQPNPPPG
jgi:hypothetical protein